MSRINMLPSVVFEGEESLDLVRLQKRFEEPLQAVLALPWADGALVMNVMMATAGVLTLNLVHRLGRAARGVLVGRASVETSAPYGLQNTSLNSCTVQVRATAPGTLDLWVY